MLSEVRSTRRAVVIAVVFAIGLPLLGLVAVTLGELVSDSAVLDRLVADREGTHFGEPDFGPGYAGRNIDYFSDCLALTMGSAPSEHTSKLGSAIASPTYGSCLPTIEALDTYSTGGEPTAWSEYYRYWHGYSVVVRPSVALFGVTITRLLAAVLLAASLLGLARQVVATGGPQFTAVLLIPLVVTTGFIDLPTSLPHVAAMTVTLAATAALVALARARDDVTRLFLGGWLSGAAIVFVDVLTTPVYGFMLATFLVGIASACRHGRRGRALAKPMIATGAGWVTGWVLMWVAKWVVAGFVFGFATVQDSIRYQAQFRIDGENDGVVQTFGYATAKNIGQWLDVPLAKLGFAVLFAIGAYQLARRHVVLRSTLSPRLLLAVPLLAPFIWFEVLRNHSQIHSWFTYRSVACVFAGMTALTLLELTADGVNETTEQPGTEPAGAQIETERTALG